MDYYEVELAESSDYDYTLGDTVTIAATSDKYPEEKDIEDVLISLNDRFKHLKVCYINDPLSENEMKEVIPFVEEVISLEIGKQYKEKQICQDKSS